MSATMTTGTVYRTRRELAERWRVTGQALVNRASEGMRPACTRGPVGDDRRSRVRVRAHGPSAASNSSVKSFGINQGEHNRVQCRR